jgi:hypothetical protein
MAIRIAVNGRALADSASPFTRLSAAEHLRVLAGSPRLDPVLIVPRGVAAPAGLSLPLNEIYASGGARSGAVFDQWHFPREARRFAAQLGLYLHPSAPLTGSMPTASVYDDGEGGTAFGRLAERWTRALSLTSLRGAAAVLRMQDLPAEGLHLRWVAVPPVVSEDFHANPATDDRSIARDLQLPEAYVLAAGEPEESLPSLLAAWTWVEGSMGDSYTLLVASAHRRVAAVADRLGVAETVRAVDIPDQAWPAVYRGASALLHGGGRRNAAGLRWALASGVPVAATSTPITEAVLGPAGFLAPPGDTRGLGSACLTLLVEEKVADPLRERGLERAAAYRSDHARQAWVEAVLAVAGGR